MEEIDSEKVLKYFQDFVIDAIINITRLTGDLSEDARLFLFFLEKIKGGGDVVGFCEQMAVSIAAKCTVEVTSWREEVYRQGIVRHLAIELANSFFELKKMRLAKTRGLQNLGY